MASSILRKLSAWRSSALKMSSLLSLVTPSTQQATSVAEALADFVGRHAGVFHQVVQESGLDGHQIHAHAGQDVGHHDPPPDRIEQLHRELEDNIREYRGYGWNRGDAGDLWGHSFDCS